MPETKKCSGCGADVPDGASFAHCPNCLLDLGFGSLPDVTEAPSAGRAVGERCFADYELLEQIGRGGMGVIYKARQLALNRLVALKMVSAGEFASPTLIQRFHLEAEAAANLHHPNIVPIYEIGVHQGQHFFSMELIDGTGLDRHITKAGFRFNLKAGEDKASLRTRQEQIARIMAKVARAVDYAHQHGVLHRDIKPSNVIIDAQGEPHLSDFGVAKVVEHTGSSLTASGAIMGTPSYMAPEQAAGQSKHVTTAADVYSLGAVLYAMLTGQPPFRAATPVETLKQVVEQEPKHPSTLKESLDRDLATICMKCLEKEPRRRYPSAVALAEDLERWLRTEPILAQPVGPTGRFWRWCRREPMLAGMVGGIAVCLVVVTVVALIAYQNAEAGRLAEQKAREAAAEFLRHSIQDQLEDLDRFWTNSNDVSVPIPSKKLARLTARAEKTNGILISFGAYTHTKPSHMFGRFAPVLSYLETNVTAIPLRFDFTIYRGYSNAIAALLNGDIGFIRPGPAAYVNARQRDPNLRVLLKQLHDGQPVIHGEIFTRSNSGITHVLQVVGKSVASADEESTFGNYAPKALFFELGIRARAFKWTYVGSHDDAIEQVVAGAYQIGTANSNVVARFTRAGAQLRVLQHMQSISFCWITSTNVDESVGRIVKDALLSLRDPSILKEIDGNLTGFSEARPEDYDEFEKNVMKKARAFEEP